MENKRPLPLQYWGLERWPFRNTPDVNQLYPTAPHTEALARIDFLVESRRRLGALLGESGVGKSLVLRAAARKLGRQGRAAVLVDAIAMTGRELLWHTAAGLGSAPRDDAEIGQLWREVADRIVENRLQRVHSVLLVDDAGQAGPDLLMQLARLAQIDGSPFARWTIILAAEPEQAARWSDSLRSLVDLRVDLGAWTLEETVGYVQTALVDAGRLQPVFDEDALPTLHELTDGLPRDVARLADFALLAGAAAGAELIDSLMIEAAHDEVAWPAAAVAY